MDEQGRLLCPGCNEWVFVGNYYPMKKDGPIWYIVGPREYPKPMSRCKDCVKKYHGGDRPMDGPQRIEMPYVPSADYDPNWIDIDIPLEEPRD